MNTSDGERIQRMAHGRSRWRGRSWRQLAMQFMLLVTMTAAVVIVCVSLDLLQHTVVTTVIPPPPSPPRHNQLHRHVLRENRTTTAVTSRSVNAFKKVSGDFDAVFDDSKTESGVDQGCDDCISRVSSRDQSMSTVSSRDQSMSTVSPSDQSMSNVSSRDQSMSSVSPREQSMSRVSSHDQSMSSVSSRDQSMSSVSPREQSMSRVSSRDQSMSSVSPREQSMSRVSSHDQSMSSVSSSDQKLSHMSSHDQSISGLSFRERSISSVSSTGQRISGVSSRDQGAVHSEFKGHQIADDGDSDRSMYRTEERSDSRDPVLLAGRTEKLADFRNWIQTTTRTTSAPVSGLSAKHPVNHNVTSILPGVSTTSKTGSVLKMAPIRPFSSSTESSKFSIVVDERDKDNVTKSITSGTNVNATYVTNKHAYNPIAHTLNPHENFVNTSRRQDSLQAAERKAADSSSHQQVPQLSQKASLTEGREQPHDEREQSLADQSSRVIGPTEHKDHLDDKHKMLPVQKKERKTTVQPKWMETDDSPPLDLEDHEVTLNSSYWRAPTAGQSHEFVGDSPLFSQDLCPGSENSASVGPSERIVHFPAKPAYLNSSKNPCWNKRQDGEGEGMPDSCVPYFYLIGISKSGTTDLFHRLIMHPDILLTRKEPHFFDKRRMKGAPLRTYVSLYRRVARLVVLDLKAFGSSKHIAGDASPSYFFDNREWQKREENKGCLEPRVVLAHDIMRLNPQARIILIYRDPVARLYSRYLFFCGVTNPCGRQFLNSERFHQLVVQGLAKYQRCFRQWSLRQCAYSKSLALSVHPGLRLQENMYSVHLEDWLRIVPRQQILVLRFETYIRNIKEELGRVYSFLELSPISDAWIRAITGAIPQNMGRLYRRAGDMKNETRTLLRAFYRPFFDRFVQLLREHNLSTPAD